MVAIGHGMMQIIHLGIIQVLYPTDEPKRTIALHKIFVYPVHILRFSKYSISAMLDATIQNP